MLMNQVGTKMGHLTDTERALEFIRNSPICFYETGSRFFGHNTVDSDYDFFVEESYDTLTALRKEGFETDYGSHYNDSHVVLVMKMGDVHVQLVRDVVLKNKIQKAISLMGPLFTNLDKQARKSVWVAFYYVHNQF